MFVNVCFQGREMISISERIRVIVLFLAQGAKIYSDLLTLSASTAIAAQNLPLYFIHTAFTAVYDYS